jgi:hypothetical protein
MVAIQRIALIYQSGVDLKSSVALLTANLQTG